MAENLRGMMTDNSSVCCCEGKALLSYVDLALQQGINFCDE
jgi:hypothetical protein